MARWAAVRHWHKQVKSLASLQGMKVGMRMAIDLEARVVEPGVEESHQKQEVERTQKIPGLNASVF